jgi:preprotein translocase subunit SecG
MDRKSLIIVALSLSAVMLMCTLVLVDRQVSAEVSVVSGQQLANLSAASVRYTAAQEALAVVDRTTHKLKVFRIVNGQSLELIAGSDRDLSKEMASPSGPPVKKKTGKL